MIWTQLFCWDDTDRPRATAEEYWGMTIKPETIAVCVCTYKRPRMLRQCLASIQPGRQKPVDVRSDLRVEYIVVDNAPSDEVSDIVTEIIPDAHYVREYRAGLSHARNAALARANQIGADWIAFIDDDEVAARDWLHNLYWSAQRHHADAVHGVVRYQFPADAPQWRRRAPWADWANHDGAELDSAGTGNVLFRTEPVYRHKLSFCPSLGQTGGEDSRFFRTYHALGGRIVFSDRPMVRETVPWSRITLRGFARKAHRNGAMKVEQARLNHRFKPRRFVRKAVSRTARGIARIAGSPLGLMAGAGLAWLSQGIDDIAEAAGMVRGLFGSAPAYYRITDGY